MDKTAEFFYENAGLSYYPENEIPEEGRVRTAHELALAERVAESRGWEVDWEQDSDAEIADLGTEWEGWPHYMALLTDDDGNILRFLGSVMFADGGDPWDGDPYARVVAAELALEALLDPS